jgi:membrane fusion protein (multidrug efflux system)
MPARRVIRWAVIVVVVIAGAVLGVRYWLHSRQFVSTDDAYVNANIVQISPQVAGPVTRVLVVDQQHVAAGQLLFEIDPQPYQIALAAAEAQLDLAHQSVAERQAAVVAARAEVAQRQAELQNAQSNDRRTRNLIAGGFLSAQSAEATHTEAATSSATLKAAQAHLEQAISALGESGADNPDVRAAEARVAQAKLDLGYARVTAPTSGTVANLTLRPGSAVAARTPVFSLISDTEFWVDANFKETQLIRVRAGQSARVVSDMYRNHAFNGQVQSLSGGSGAAFSLLPPENATGNWVKVTQRVPVRVRILDPDPAHPLRIGTTATVEVKAR